MKDEKINQEKGMRRRSFLKLISSSILSAPLWMNTKNALGLGDIEKNGYWHLNHEGKEYCIHNTVKSSQLDKGIISAKVDGRWQSYQVVGLDKKFMEWYRQEKLQFYEDIGKRKIWWGGHHHPAVATYGNKRGRGDSSFHLNITTKSVNIVPRYEKLVEINRYLKDHQNSNGMEVLNYLKNLYSDPEIWDPTKLISVEYYTKNPDLIRVTGYKETHTFLNMMKNPIANLCFLAVWRPNFSTEIRTIPHLLDLDNPNLTKKEKEYAKHPNLLQTAFHKDRIGTQNIACLYYVVEEFRQGTLPSNSNDEGRGVRVVPPPPRWLVRFKNMFKTIKSLV